MSAGGDAQPSLYEDERGGASCSVTPPNAQFAHAHMYNLQCHLFREHEQSSSINNSCYWLIIISEDRAILLKRLKSRSLLSLSKPMNSMHLNCRPEAVHFQFS